MPSGRRQSFHRVLGKVAGDSTRNANANANESPTFCNDKRSEIVIWDSCPGPDHHQTLIDSSI